MTLSAPNNPVEARGKASKRAVSSLTAVRRTEGLTAPKRTFVVGVARPAPSLLQRAEGSLMAVQRGSRSNLSEQPFWLVVGSPRMKFIGVDLSLKMAEVDVGLSRKPVCPPREALQRFNFEQQTSCHRRV